MSGTSLDGIDVAIVDIAQARSVETVGFTRRRIPTAVREAILAVSNATTHTAAISRLNFQLGELYAQRRAAQLRRSARTVELIGCHGQTIYHEERASQHAADRRSRP